MSTDVRWQAVLASALSAVLGYVILWIVLEAGKKAFGKKRIRLEAPTPFTWTRKGDDADFVVGEEQGLWSDYFARESDQLILHCDEAVVDDRNLSARRPPLPLRSREDRRRRNRARYARSNQRRRARAGNSARSHGPRRPEISRRPSARFSVGAPCCSVFLPGRLLGSLVGLGTLIIGKRVWSAKLPFGPYLAFGGLTWLFFGEALVRWYTGCSIRSDGLDLARRAIGRVKRAADLGQPVLDLFEIFVQPEFENLADRRVIEIVTEPAG